ncbi:MAG: hypothetical protein MUF36_12145 [Bacteroidales bacterium]|jgi:hypothetical protein|nr:hypothetical protein [Bacteroidales bacterium]
MKDIEVNVKKSPKRRKAVIALIIAAVSQVLLAVILFLIPPLIPDFVFGILMALTFLDIVVISLILTPNYNLGIFFLVMVIAAIFFRRMRWPVTGILFTIGFSGLALFSISFAAIFLRRFKRNPFLRFIGFASCIVLSIVSMGLLWKNMHWPLGNYMLATGLGIFIPFLFAFVFTLPGSNYINWNKSERLLFFRVIVIPMVFVYTLCVLMFVLPELWTAITRSQLLPFSMLDFELLNKPGIL